MSKLRLWLSWDFVRTRIIGRIRDFFVKLFSVKPKDKDDAFNMLKKLSGREHEVITGVCLAYNGKYETFHCVSKVRFYPLTDEEIRHYVASGEPLDKAGAYGIQGKGMMLVESIEGDFYNIVGLPVALVVRKIKELENRHED